MPQWQKEGKPEDVNIHSTLEDIVDIKNNDVKTNSVVMTVYLCEYMVHLATFRLNTGIQELKKFVKIQSNLCKHNCTSHRENITEN